MPNQTEAFARIDPRLPFEAHLRSLAAGMVRFVSMGRTFNSDCIQMRIKSDRVTAYAVGGIGSLVVVSLEDCDSARLSAAVGSAIKLFERLAKT